MTQIVKMKGMNKYFGKLHVLKDIDLTVEQGEVVVIIGASGSGKSTLIRCVNGLEEYESGSLEVDNHPLAPPKGGGIRTAWRKSARKWAWCSSSSTCSRT